MVIDCVASVHEGFQRSPSQKTITLGLNYDIAEGMQAFKFP